MRHDIDGLTPHERDVRKAMLLGIDRVKQAIREFDDGDINLHDAWRRILMATGRRVAA